MANLNISNWKSILQDIYYPVIGSIWVAPNGIWKNGFAKNKNKEDFHPSVVGRVYNENRQCWLIPGTSKEHIIGANVFRKARMSAVNFLCILDIFPVLSHEMTQPYVIFAQLN